MQAVRISLSIPAAGAEPLVWAIAPYAHGWRTVVVGGMHPDGSEARLHDTLAAAVLEVQADQLALLSEFANPHEA